MVQDIIDFVDRDILLATDGSAEGILTALSARSGQTSMFIRDEVVGFFNEIGNKQYLAGIPQMFTQLYDRQFIARKLRKETITVTDPVFLFFGCGIKDQFFVAVNEEFVYSGFLPRFLIVSGETEIDDLRRLGPPTAKVSDQRQKIYETANELYKRYVVTNEVTITSQTAQIPVTIDAVLTQDAWDLNGEIAHRMTQAAYNSVNSGLALPTFERLSASMLKMSILIAAARQKPVDNQIEVTPEDLRRATKYVQQWGNYTIEVISNLGQNANMRLIERVNGFISKNPGIPRSRVMNAMNLTKRQIQEVEETLEARGDIRIETSGRGRAYHPVY